MVTYVRAYVPGTRYSIQSTWYISLLSYTWYSTHAYKIRTKHKYYYNLLFSMCNYHSLLSLLSMTALLAVLNNFNILTRPLGWCGGA